MSLVKANPKNWEEDYPDENGCYQNRCMVCGELFFGHKYRRICKICLTKYEKEKQL